MKNNGLFINAFLLALTRFALMPIISAVLVIAGLFTDILATWIGIGFFALYLILCLIFAIKVANADTDGEDKQ